MLMISFYRKISARIPENFTKPTPSFKKHVWFSIFGLLLFIVLYLALTIWFGKLAYNLFSDALSFDGHGYNFFLGIGFGFLSLFMAKSLFFLNKKEKNPIHHNYLNEKEEPILFDYLYKLADEAGAPRPHKVFLTDRVNASVSYDISLINLLFPSKKNLEIGLGLVNVLSLGELKAVLAHEFGHFAQRSMLLGRYVYVAQKIAARIVGKRDIFDDFLAGLSTIDIRIAWIGWILSILVWSIRSLIETCFSIVVVAERALSREMEFQADLVAVSLTGSDALINALYKLQVADEAYSNTLDCINEELGEKRAITDMYTLQTNYIQKMAVILDDAKYGKSPVIPRIDSENYRIFTSKKYNPPQMWATHPADVDRENNAKKIYISEPVDNRSSWDLFSKPKQYREEMTANLIKSAKLETTLISNEDAINKQDKIHFNWTFLNPKYHSAFFGRFAFLSFKDSEDIYNVDLPNTITAKDFNALYPKDISKKISLLQEIKQEKEALIISKNEAITVEKRRISHRGNVIKRKDIPDILKALDQEVSALNKELKTHDALCRSLHYKAAKRISSDFALYLKQLASLVHYSEHSISNINDVASKFNNVLAVALADGNVSSSELTDILNVSHDYYKVLRAIYKHSETLVLSPELLKNMDVKSYQSIFEEFKLPAADRENINDWVNVVSGWASVALNGLNKLRNESLELLLETEEKVKEAYLHNENLESKTKILHLPQDYDTLVPGSERKIQRTLGAWDRFAVGDGLIPSIAKFGVSGSILFAAIFFGNYSQKLPMYIYNGLQTNVKVIVDNETIALQPNSSETLQLNYGKDYHVVTTTSEGEIIEEEDFKFRTHTPSVYNIANAGAFVEYPIFYGYSFTPLGINDSKFLGAKKWFSTNSDYVFEEPPSSISMSSSSSGKRKEALRAYSNETPDNLISLVQDSTEQQQMITSHSKWDNSNSKNIISWMYYLNNVTNGVEVAESRLSKYPKDILSLRSIQDLSDSIARQKICEKHIQLAIDSPNNPDYYYLSTRCVEDEAEKNNKFLEGYQKWPDHHWLAYASAFIYVEEEAYKEAYDAYKIAVLNNDPMAETLALDIERIKRVLNNFTNKGYETVINNEEVKYYNTLERGIVVDSEENSEYAYYLLSKGQLDEAYQLAKKDESSKAYVLRLIAASKGASNKIQLEALKLTEEDGLNINSIWSAVGLAIKHNKDYDQYIKILSTLDLKENEINNLIGLIKTKQYSLVEKQMKPFGIRWKAQVYVMASIILDGDIPDKWKKIANGALFVNEKPYLE